VSSYIPRPLSDVNCVLLTDLDNVLVEILQENKGSVMSVLNIIYTNCHWIIFQFCSLGTSTYGLVTSNFTLQESRVIESTGPCC